MDEKYKGLVRALVKHHMRTNTDIIPDKGQGVVILLHGECYPQSLTTHRILIDMCHRWTWTWKDCEPLEARNPRNNISDLVIANRRVYRIGHGKTTLRCQCR